MFSSLTYLKEFTSVHVAVVDPDGSTTNSNVKTNTEVSWLEWHITSVLLQHHLAIEEGTLHGTSINLLGLNHED